MESAQRLYEAEVEAIEREFEEERARLKDRMIQELLEERKRLMDELEPTLSAPLAASLTTAPVAPPGSSNNWNSDGRGNKRSLRKRTAEEQRGTSLAAATASAAAAVANNAPAVKETKRKGVSPYDQLGRLGIETRLTEEEVYDDINTIYREDGRGGRRTAPRTASAAATAASTTASAPSSQPPLQPPPAPIHQKSAASGPRTTGPKGPTAVISGLDDELIDVHVDERTFTLHYDGDKTFCPGDAISCYVSHSDSTFVGTVSTITPNELWIKRADNGTSNKIYIGQLRIGKYKITHA